MENIRYILAVISVILLPPASLAWFIIHPWARQWRRLGPSRTSLIVVPFWILVGAALYSVRQTLIGLNLGTNWILIAIAAVPYALSVYLHFKYRKHLTLPILLGIPELSATEQSKGKLLQEGIYGVVRHPRYLSAGRGLLGLTLIVNYEGVYILAVLIVPVGYVLMLLEERELIERFGKEESPDSPWKK
jgi:protein-S-isoprenylcysteine O-methyltransferase Ste14